MLLLKVATLCYVLSERIAMALSQVDSTKDSCIEKRNGAFPCSATITGNLILIIFYGALITAAAKLISDGAEMLLDFGLSPSVIGGVVLPVLGSVPDCAIIIASGLGDDAQEKLSVGMGTLAGSTVMLLTIAWAASVIIGRCDLGSNGEAEDGMCEGTLSLTHQGVTVFIDVTRSTYFMLTTSLPYLLVQSADWYWGAKRINSQPRYVKRAALATMVFCIIDLIAYVTYSILNSKKNELVKKAISEKDISFSTNKNIGPSSDSEDLFNKEQNRTSYMNLRTIENRFSSENIIDHDPTRKHTLNKNGVKCIAFLLLGAAIVAIFSDPMCDVLTALANPNNKSFISIPPFYISFVITSFCTNASELVSSLIFANKKTKETITMAISQLLGSATMNNTLCLGIFMALVYFRDLEWIYGAEVVCVLLVQWVVGGITLVRTYKVWMSFPVGMMYPICILLVWILEMEAGWY